MADIQDKRLIKEALLAAVGIAVAYLVLRTAPALAAGAFSDDGVYLALGKALADGEGYRSLYAAGQPVHMKYPPALPALYALLWWIKPDLATVHGAATVLSLLASAFAAGLLWWLARAKLSLHPSTALVFVMGPFLLEGAVQYFNLPISEPWFMLGWAGCLVLFGRMIRGALSWSVALGLLMAGTTLFRTQAVVFIPALIAAAFMSGAGLKRCATLGLTAVVPVGAWRLWHGMRAAAGPLTSQPDEATYLSWTPDGSVGAVVRFLSDILTSQALRYWTVLPPNVASWRPVGVGLCVAVLALVLVGVASRWRGQWALVATVLTAAAVITLWPYSQDRFVLALLPFLGLLAGAGWERIVARWTRPPSVGKPVGKAVALGVLVLWVGIVGWRQAQIRGLAVQERSREEFYFHPAQFLPDNSRFILEASRWVARNTRPEDRILTPLSAAIWLYTGRVGVNATPAEPNVGPSVFDEPGRFLARRILEDDVTILLLWNPNFLISRDGATIQSACPAALEFLGMTPGSARVAAFRIHKRDPCLARRFLDPAAQTLS